MRRAGTRYIAISRISQERIARYWNVDAPIIHPPVELGRFAPGEPEDFVLIVCELVRHKRVDLALEAARRAGVAVKVVGGGADEPRLRSVYGDHAEFLGRIDDDALAALYPRALALVMPNVEEFGITAVEAQASGRPVIAAAAGGALETVIDGVTGVLVPPGDVDALTAVLRDEDLGRFDSSWQSPTPSASPSPRSELVSGHTSTRCSQGVRGRLRTRRDEVSETASSPRAQKVCWRR